MRISSKFKTILPSAFVLVLLSCNNSKKKNVITLQDIKQEKKFIEPPPPPPPRDSPPPRMEIKGGKTTCFVNEGLKYKTTVTLGFNDSEAIGIVSSEEIGSGKKRSTGFKGTRKSNGFTIEFIKDKPPVIGDASEWTTQPWTLKKEGAKETLHIIFNAKNHETNKWEDIDYQFVQGDCNNIVQQL